MTLVLSVILNAYLLFLPKKLIVTKEIAWSTDSMSARGYLEPVNYEEPKDWNTIFFIDALNIGEREKARFFAKEIVVAGGVLINLNLKEYPIVEANEGKIVAQDNTYRFEITKDEVSITDKDGEVARLSDMYKIEL